jgi:hypothetical protein
MNYESFEGPDRPEIEARNRARRAEVEAVLRESLEASPDEEDLSHGKDNPFSNEAWSENRKRAGAQRYRLLDKHWEAHVAENHARCEYEDDNGATCPAAATQSLQVEDYDEHRIPEMLALCSKHYRDASQRIKEAERERCKQDAESAAIRSHLGICDLCDEDNEVFCPFYWTAGREA